MPESPPPSARTSTAPPDDLKSKRDRLTPEERDLLAEIDAAFMRGDAHFPLLGNEKAAETVRVYCASIRKAGAH